MKKGWEYKKLGEVCEIYQPTTIATSQLNPNGKYLVYGANGIIGRYNEYNHEEAEVLLCCRGATCGAINLSQPKSWVNGNAMVVKPKTNEIRKDFLIFLLTSLDYTHIITGAAQPQITRKSLSPVSIGFPPLPEQKAIVEYLDSSFAKIDKLKENAAKNLEEAKALFQSALKDALEPKEGWEEKTLGEAGTFKRGGNFSKKDFIENGFPCIHYGQIHTKFGIETFEHLSSVPTEMVKPDRCAQKGDLVIAITSEDDAGSCKCTAWMGDYEVYVGGHTAIYHHSMEPKFVSYYFMSPYFQKAKLEYTHGFKVVEINPKDIAKISVHIPPLSEQQEIVSRLDSLSEKLNTLQQNYSRICSECDALKQSILRQVFE